MIKLFLVLAGFAMLLPSMFSPAYAQDVTSTIVSVPWGDWLFDAASTIILVVGAVVGWGLRQLPARLLAIVQTTQLDQLLLRAIDGAVNQTAGATKGREMKIDVANQVLATALRYAIEHGPKWMIKWAGGELALREKIIARLEVEADAALK